MLMLRDAALPVTSDETRLAPLMPAREYHRPWNPEQNKMRFEDWCAAMRKGDFEAAWQINDMETQHWPSAHQLWRGEPLHQAAVELEARHGLGDFVQMIRFVPLLNRLGCTVSVKVRPELRALAPYFKGTFTIAATGERTARHQSIEMMELPYALRLQSDQLPTRTNYLVLPPETLGQQRVQARTRGAALNIGIVWSGSAWDPERWISFDSLRPLLDMTCIDWWSMQGGDSVSLERHPQLHEVGPQSRGSLVAFAAAIKGLDLLITVDTLAAHIAGALGTEVWVLLKKHADWRWLQNRSDSPWYPSMRLFRQHDAGDWSSVLSAVQTALRQRCDSRR